MKNYIVTFIYNVGEPEHAENVAALDYTKAYLHIIFKYHNQIIIINVEEIKKNECI